MNLNDLVDPALTVGEDTTLDLQISEAVQHGLVTFDTNVLLDLYLLDAADGNSLFTSLQGPLKERLWLTHQVAQEYAHLRDTRARTRQKKLQTLLSEQKTLLDKLRGRLLEPFRQEKIPLDETTFPDWRSGLDAWLTPYNQQVQQQIDLLDQFSDPAEDPILHQLSRLFGERITPELPATDLPAFFHDAQVRYAFHIPPGYADQAEKQKKYPQHPRVPYGDLLLWEQLIRLAVQSDLPGVLLISSETKEDWVEQQDFGDGTGRIILRRDLKREFRERTGKDINLLGLKEFLQVAQRLQVLQPTPQLGQLLRGILEQDLQRLTNLRTLVHEDLLRQKSTVQSTLTSLEALEARWTQHDQFEAPDPNQAFVQYNRMRETLQEALRNRLELVTSTRAALERLDQQMEQVRGQLSPP